MLRLVLAVDIYPDDFVNRKRPKSLWLQNRAIYFSSNSSPTDQLTLPVSPFSTGSNNHQGSNFALRYSLCSSLLKPHMPCVPVIAMFSSVFLGMLLPHAAAWPFKLPPFGLDTRQASPMAWWDNVTISDVTFKCERSDDKALFDCGLGCKIQQAPFLSFCLAAFGVNYLIVNFDNPNAAPFEKVRSAFCRKAWKWDGITTDDGPKNNYGHGHYALCWREEYRVFQFAVESFHSPANFTISLNTKYHDPTCVFPRTRLPFLLWPCRERD
jgi:hypothetical protein